MEETAMKKLGYIIAAVGALAIAAPSIASAEKIVIKEGHGHHHDRMGPRAEMRHGGWHHHDRVTIVKHRHAY
jgi:hypothetical protein